LLTLRRPLHIAALNGHAVIIKTLFEAGAKLDARNFSTETALHVAADEGELEATQMLIELCGSDEEEASSSEESLRETEHLTSGAGSKNFSIEANGKCMLRIPAFDILLTTGSNKTRVLGDAGRASRNAASLRTQV
jgi:ankyrin repeat protein